jgi:hypothetical protein
VEVCDHERSPSHGQHDEDDDDDSARRPTAQKELPRGPDHYPESEESDVSSNWNWLRPEREIEPGKEADENAQPPKCHAESRTHVGLIGHGPPILESRVVRFPTCSGGFFDPNASSSCEETATGRSAAVQSARRTRRPRGGRMSLSSRTTSFAVIRATPPPQCGKVL